MTRDSKTISAVFMAVVLILASGTAVSFAVTADNGSNAVGVQDETTTEEAAQETTTEVIGANETTEEDGVTEEETTTEEDGVTEEEEVSVTIDEQASDGEEIVISSVTMAEGGFVAIHSEDWESAPLATVLGNSVYLEAGTQENVTVTLARPLEDTQTVVAMPHLDTNDNEVYDFVLSSGNLDGPYTDEEGSAVVDEAEVTVGEETTTPEEVNETTTEEEVVEDNETTTEEDVIGDNETTTEEEVVEDNETTTEEEVIGDNETTTEEDEVVEDNETTTEEDEVVEDNETTTEEDEVVEDNETTTEEDEVVEDNETTTEEDVIDETTTEEDEDVVEETPTTEMQQFVFKVEEMSIERWSFVIGDEETPDETVYVNGTELFPPDGSLSDERMTVDLAELQEQGELEEGDLMETPDPEEVEQDLQENLSEDIPTVRYVIQNVNVENVTLVVLAPEDMELVEEPPVEETTPEEDDEEDVLNETTTEEDEEVVNETTTEEDEEDVINETTTEEDEEVVNETTTEEEEVVNETTTEEDEEEVINETTTEEDEEVVDETTTEEEEVVNETTTEEEEVVNETTTEEEVEEPTAEVPSFEVSGLDAPESATVGETVEVSATVTNPHDEEATQSVAFRLNGNVLAREDVTLDAGEETTVTFEVDTTGVPAGEYVHGVYTEDFGEVTTITLEESADSEDDTGDDTAETTTTTVEA